MQDAVSAGALHNEHACKLQAGGDQIQPDRVAAANAGEHQRPHQVWEIIFVTGPRFPFIEGASEGASFTNWLENSAALIMEAQGLNYFTLSFELG